MSYLSRKRRSEALNLANRRDTYFEEQAGPNKLVSQSRPRVLIRTEGMASLLGCQRGQPYAPRSTERSVEYPRRPYKFQRREPSAHAGGQRWSMWKGSPPLVHEREQRPHSRQRYDISTVEVLALVSTLKDRGARPSVNSSNPTCPLEQSSYHNHHLIQPPIYARTVTASGLGASLFPTPYQSWKPFTRKESTPNLAKKG